MSKKTLLLCAAIVASLLAISVPGGAQAPTSGQIIIQVLDTSGAAIPNSTVTVTNAATGEIRKVQTDSQGHYAVADLPIGTYDVTAEKEGFERQVQKGVTVDVATSVRLNLTLQVGSIRQEVVVKSQAPIINTTDASTSTVMQNQQIAELPINGRDYARFALLTPGAVFRTNYVADLTFDGLHSVHNQFSIDGIDASRVDQPYMANGYERGARLLTGSLDTVAEFTVQTSDYGAQYGRAAGSYVNIATKSGTNQFHGTMFEFFRNNNLDAINFFAEPGPAPEFRYNNFGGNIGGPIQKNKTFFFLNYEGSRQRVGITGSGTVPSALARSEVLATSPQLAPIVDLFPLGTSPTSNDLVDNYTTSAVSFVREDTSSMRFDHSFSDKDTAFVRVNVNDSNVHGPLFGVIGSALGVYDHQIVPLRTTNVAIHEEHVFGNGMINDFLAGAQRWGSQVSSLEPWPLTYIGGLTVDPGNEGYFLENNSSFQFGDTMSKIKGRHSLTWGATVWRVWVNANSSNSADMFFGSMQDFINDSVAEVYLSPAKPTNGVRATQVGAFVNDTYQVRPKLSLSYGLRYDIETVPHDAFYGTRPFDTRTQTLGPTGDPYFQINRADFAPRVGLAWAPLSGMVVRVGYGIFYQAYPVGFGSYYVPYNTLPGATTLLEAEIPNLTYPYTPFLSQGAALPPPNVYGFPWHKPDIHTHQWTVSVAKQLTANNSFQVAYVGNLGRNLWREEDINLFDPAISARPNPNFGDIYLEGNEGDSFYEGLEVSFTRRLASGLFFAANYTYGHAIDDVQDQGIWASDPQDLNNLKAEKGNGSGDVRHALNFNLLYNLPMGTGHRFASSRVASYFASGWRISTLGLLRTGIASTVYIPESESGNDFYTNQRPDAVAGVSQYPITKTVNDWLNINAYSTPAAGTFGNLGRNTYYGPSMEQIDFSILREAKIAEGKNLEFRVEFFNIFNHPIFDEPDYGNATYSGPSTAGFGEIFDTLGRTIGEGTSRQIQFAIKFTF
jgi:hypothetical protein